MRGKKLDGFVTREQVIEDLFSRWTPTVETELIPLDEAIGRVTARELYSVNSLPVHRSSGCDGIAVKSELFKNGMPDYKSWREGVEYVRADTGDDFDDQFDAVIMIEEVDFSADGTTIEFISDDIEITEGINIFKKGSTVAEGERIMNAYMPIRPLDFAVLAMGGLGMVPVVKRPKVAFIPTGNELIPPQMTPIRGQNIDTNSLLIRETLRSFGADPIVFPIIPDDQLRLEKALEEGIQSADIVVLNGGTARGDEDYNVALIRQKGQLLHHYVSAAPGRPLAVGLVKGKPVINLPGPTVAAFFGAYWCLRQIVCRGLHIPVPQGDRALCTLTQDITSNPAMAILCLMEVKRGADGYLAVPHSLFEESTPAYLSANALYVSPIGESERKAGTEIELELLRGREYIR